ncbi:MAG: hypothetical protein IKS42_00360 [Oscillospiraceae bacterium]|nr:hypothetical protein [Oscillospiraceae bacterium]
MSTMRYYRVEHCGRTYEFQFEYTYKLSEGYRAYIESTPSYGRRSQTLHATHRSKTGDRYYICWSKRIHSKKDMDTVTALWCKATVMYIVYGGKSMDIYADRLIRAG